MTDVKELLDNAMDILVHIAMSATNETKKEYVNRIAGDLVKRYSK